MTEEDYHYYHKVVVERKIFNIPANCESDLDTDLDVDVEPTELARTQQLDVGYYILVAVMLKSH